MSSQSDTQSSVVDACIGESCHNASQHSVTTDHRRSWANHIRTTSAGNITYLPVLTVPDQSLLLTAEASVYTLSIYKWHASLYKLPCCLQIHPRQFVHRIQHYEQNKAIYLFWYNWSFSYVQIHSHTEYFILIVILISLSVCLKCSNTVSNHITFATVRNIIMKLHSTHCSSIVLFTTTVTSNYCKNAPKLAVL